MNTNLTEAQRKEKARQMHVAGQAADIFNTLPADVVFATVEAHFIGRGDIDPGALEKMADRIRQHAWFRERGQI